MLYKLQCFTLKFKTRVAIAVNGVIVSDVSQLNSAGWLRKKRREIGIKRVVIEAIKSGNASRVSLNEEIYL